MTHNPTNLPYKPKEARDERIWGSPYCSSAHHITVLGPGVVDNSGKNRLGVPNCDLHFKPLVYRGSPLSTLGTAAYGVFFGALAAGMLYFLING